MTDPAWRRLLLPALLLGVVLILYGRTLTYDFVNYDDYDLVARNTEFLRDPANLLNSFTTHAFTSHREEGVYYRPVLLISYFGDYFIWGVNPAGYHLTNVCLHALATLFLFFLVRETLRQSVDAPRASGPADRDSENGTIAFFTSLIFAAHPVQSESVAWVAGRNDVLLGVLLIASLWCYVLQYRESHFQKFMFPLSALLFAAALLTKESAIFFAPLFPLYELGVRRESLESLFSGEKHLRVSMYLAIALAYLGVRYTLFGAFIGSEKLYGKIPFDNRLLMAPGLALTNILYMVWPSSLSIVHPIENVIWFDWPLILVASTVSAGMLAAAVFLFRKAPILSWAIAWMILGLIPLMNVFPMAVPILEHRLYVVTAGLAFAFTIVVSKIFRNPGRRKLFAPALILVSVSLSTLTWARVPVWRDSESLWLDAIDKEPNGARAYLNLAGFYYERGEHVRVVPLLEKYVALRPDDFMGYSKLRQSYFLTGRLSEAAGVCRTLIDQNPENVARYLEAGVLFERLGISDSVISIYKEGLAVDPGFHQLHNRLGIWFGRLGDSVNSRLHLAAADSVSRILQSPVLR